MKNQFKSILAAVLAGLFFSCGSPAGSCDFTEAEPYIVPRYAELFRVRKTDKYVVADVYDPADTIRVFRRYVLYRDEADRPECSDAVAVKIPLETVGCAHSTQIGFLDRLDLLDKISCIGSKSLLESKSAMADRDAGEFYDGFRFDVEQLLQYAPGAVFFTLTGSEDMTPVQSLDIPFIYDMSAWEIHPLARAEWIKFVALFFDESERADSVFAGVARRYNEVAGKIKSAPVRPTVFSGTPYQNVWHVPAGKSYKALLFRDAGLDYAWADDTNTKSLPLDVESVYARCNGTDFWVFESWLSGRRIDALLLSNELFEKFSAVRNHRVIICDTRSEPFYEQGIMEPDVLLSDLIYLTHDGLLPGYAPKYYFFAD